MKILLQNETFGKKLYALRTSYSLSWKVPS